MRFSLFVFLFFAEVAIAGGVNYEADIAAVVKQGRGTTGGRAAWERLSKADAAIVPVLLDAMSTKDTVAANWMRLAIDRIAERELKKIDSGKMMAFIKNADKEGRARRYALELLDRQSPGTSDKLYPDWLDDPEFRYDAVASLLKLAPTISRATFARSIYQKAFDKARDITQAREAAFGLEEFGIKVSVAEHLGFLMDWHLIGPFDGKGQKGLHLTYLPEKKIDLTEELDGQTGKVRWKPYKVKEPAHRSGARHQALVDLREPKALGNADDAVAFAYTEFTVDKAMAVEMRGAADDNFAVYVNGVKAFAFEEWRNGVRHDRHRFPVQLRAGKNAVLVKISQSAAPNPEPNWEFFLRVVDATGKGIAKK